jgi:2-methylcitrate dehydratase PrpD
MTTTATEQLGAFVAALAPNAIGAALRGRLPLHVADSIAAWIAGAHTAEGRALIGHWQRLQGSGDTVSVAALPERVARNCALARLSEIDDIHLASMTTPGSIVVVGALTIARTLPDVDPADLAPAILAGYEAMIRLGRAIDGPTMLYRGIWPTCFAAPFGMAAVTARLLRLDAGQTAHALALGLTLASPGVGHHNAATTSRWFAAGNAARNGVTAALAARSGFTSDLKLVEGGFLANVYGLTPNAAALTDGRGAGTLEQVSFKPWCAARQTMAATQGLREIIDGGVRVADITAVHAAVLPPHQKMIDHGVTAGDRASHLTSLPYQMAVAALDPAAADDVGQARQNLDPALQAFMGRITVTSDPALLANYPAAWPARVTVTTTAGTHERIVSQVPGDPARPFGRHDMASKFARFVGPVIGAQAAGEFFARIVDGSDETLPRAVDEIDMLCRQ